MADYISKKQIVGLKKFLQNYYCLNCKWKGKMTHKRMSEFLSEKGKKLHKVSFDKINKEKKLKGNYIYVKDEVGQIIAYKNPCINYNELIFESKSKQELEQIRIKLLEQQGFTYDEEGNVITIEEAEEIKKLKLEKEQEEKLNKEQDMEYEYYEKMSLSNRTLVKIKAEPHKYRRVL